MRLEVPDDHVHLAGLRLPRCLFGGVGVGWGEMIDPFLGVCCVGFEKFSIRFDSLVSFGRGCWQWRRLLDLFGA